MWRFAVAIFFALHGLVHLIGVTVYWKLGEPEGFTYPTTLLDGRLDAPVAVVWIMGGLWLLATAGFIATAVGWLRRDPRFRDLALITTLVSLALCVLAMPDAVAGVAIDLVILAALLGASLVEYLPRGHHPRPA